MQREKALQILEQIEEIGRISAKGSNIMVTCPFAQWTHGKGRDSRPSCGVLVVEDDESLYNCFACGKKGTLHDLVTDLGVLREDTVYEDLSELVLEYEEIDFEALADRVGEEPRVRMTRREKEDMLEARPEDELEPFKGSVPQYAIERGILLESCKTWELGHDRSKERLVFPVRRAKDKALVGVIGRSYIGEEPSYLDYIGFAKSKFLFGEWMVREDASRIVVVEGPIDVIACWQAGESALGIMGAFASSDQVRKLEYLEKPVFLFPDGDKAGAKWANQLGDELRELGVQVRDVPVKTDEDPSDIPTEKIKGVIDRARVRI